MPIGQLQPPLQTSPCFCMHHFWASNNLPPTWSAPQTSHNGQIEVSNKTLSSSLKPPWSVLHWAFKASNLSLVSWERTSWIWCWRPVYLGLGLALEKAREARVALRNFRFVKCMLVLFFCICE